MERAFLCKKLKSNQSPYARFYLTLKAHNLKPGQTVDQLKSRPIVSYPGSLLHGLGVWLDRKLQEVDQRTVSYFKNKLGTQETTSRFEPTNKRTLIHCQRCVNVHQHPNTHGAELDRKIPQSVSTKT